MHKLILCCFNILYNIGNLFSILCSLSIIMITLYWIENIIKASWTWLDFIRPIFDSIINYINGFLPFFENIFGKFFDSKFLTAIIAFVILLVITKYILNKIQELQDVYNNIHFKYKINTEQNFNKNLAQKITKEQKQLSKYMVLINTKLKKKFSHEEINIDIDEQNKLMNDFIISKTGVQYQNFNGGFLYYFDNFEKIDHVIAVLFKVLKSSAPLDYSICIQIGADLKQIKKLSDLENFGKIIMCADTLLRYKHNQGHRFATECNGVYQKADGTIEVHEFKEIPI